MRLLRKIGFAFVLPVLLAACATSRVPPSADAAAAPPATQPLARGVCAALHNLPAERRQACCGSASANLTELCTNELSAALQRGSVSADIRSIAACAAASADALQGCDWVTPLLPALPAACSALLEGRLAAGAMCRSSLECSDGLYCRNLSPSEPGVCALPAAAGARCAAPADNLASYVRAQDDPRHPHCDGVCLRGQCLARVAPGQNCASSALCAAGHNCIAGRCQALPLPTVGAACSAQLDCAADSVCQEGICRARKGTGGSCRLPFECRSLACTKSPGAELGVCADACTTTVSPTL